MRLVLAHQPYLPRHARPWRVLGRVLRNNDAVVAMSLGVLCWGSVIACVWR